jgi:hypothetical protein
VEIYIHTVIGPSTISSEYFEQMTWGPNPFAVSLWFGMWRTLFVGAFTSREGELRGDRVKTGTCTRESESHIHSLIFGILLMSEQAIGGLFEHEEDGRANPSQM